MTAATAQLCGHRWHQGRRRREGDQCVCDRPAGHAHDMLLRQPQQCRCRCGATTTRERTDHDRAE